jgi:hypothetical protein
MSMKLVGRFTFLLSAVTSLAVHIVDAYHYSAFEDEELLLPTQTHRLLPGDCGPNYYYETIIAMESEYSLSCSADNLKDIGNDLDKAFDDVVHIDQALSDIELDTAVCANADKRRNRKLQVEAVDMSNITKRDLGASTLRLKYSWSGGGKCKLCDPDEDDKRRRLIFADEAQHKNGGIEHDQRELREAYAVIDFNTDGKGNTLTIADGVRQIVEDEWHADYGMTIMLDDRRNKTRAAGRKDPVTPKQIRMAQIFDSSTRQGPAAKNLGSPNELCPGGGPGVGAAGAPGMVGENCVPQGNILIAQHPRNVRQPGDIVFAFDSPTRVGHIGIMGTDEGSKSWLDIETHEGDAIQLDFTGLGDNGVQIVHVDYAVKNIQVVMATPGAITEIGIFTPTKANQALSAKARSYIENKNPFAELIPYLEFDISYYLTRHINAEFGRDTKSCLLDKWVTIDVTLNSVEKKPSTKC